MRSIFVLASLVLSIVEGHAGQSSNGELVLLVTTGEYYGETYTETPRDNARFVFFTGEAIKLRVTIVNQGLDDSELRWRIPAGQSVFTITSLRDLDPVEIPVGFGEGRQRSAVDRSTSPVSLSQPAALRAGEAIIWDAEVSNPLNPGQYKITVNVNATDGLSRRIVPRATMFSFEVRPRGAAARVEIARRNATRHLADNHLDDAEAAVEELARLLPNSSAASLIRGHIASQRGAAAAARAHFDRAVEILRSDSDTLLLKFKDRREVDRMISSATALANRPQ